MSNDSRITVDTVYGKMVINRHDTIRGRSLIECGKANDHPEIELLLELLNRRGPGCVAIDVGANFGCFTLAFAKAGTRVIAVEMQVAIYLDLVDSIALASPAVDVTAVLGIVGRAGSGPYAYRIPDYGAPQDFGSIAAVRIAPSEILADLAHRQPGILSTVDELVEEYIDQYAPPRLDLLKIDVEGMEMEVLLGAEETINRFHPILYVEYLHSDELALIRWIKAHGYDRVRKVGINLLADPNPVAVPFRPVVGWPDLQAITDAWPTWRPEECAEWNRLSEIVDQLTVIDELQGADNRAVERVQTRTGRSLAERCDHGILLWLECGHCKTHVGGDLPTLLSPAALVTLERLAESAPKGCFVEVGVFRGGSAQRLYRIAERQGRQVWLFDTFVGLVHRSSIDAMPVGRFDAGGAAAAVAVQEALPNARVIMGVFPHVLRELQRFPNPAYAADGPVDVAFAHIDCDQYQSVKDAIGALWPRAVSGTIFLCDDYDALHGAQAAIRESAWALAHIRPDSIELTPEGKAVLRKP